MRVSFGLPTHRVDIPELVTASAIATLAAAAEAAGFDAVFVTEHPFPGDEWLASGGHHALDPFVALSFAAAATSRIRLQTNLVIPAYRNPFLIAKAAASLDHLSGGRVILGIGSGYLSPAFHAPRRGQRPGPPIWIGGNSGVAMRRAVELADGWTPLLAPPRMSARVATRPIGSVDDLASRIAEARAYAVSIGRVAPLEVGLKPGRAVGGGG